MACRRRYTQDSLFNGELICFQHSDGYRFSVDAVLAAHFCRIRESCRVLDLGCGSGIIGLILARLHPETVVSGLEIQKDLVDLAEKNIRWNRLEHRMKVSFGDIRTIRQIMPAESFDLVVCNPPYRKCGSGRVNLDDEAAIARHELKADLADILDGAVYCVKNRRPVVLVYPAARFAHLAELLGTRKLALKRMQPVYSYPEDDRASLVLVEAVKNGGEGCRILPPFYIYAEKNGKYSSRMQQLYDGTQNKPDYQQ